MSDKEKLLDIIKHESKHWKQQLDFAKDDKSKQRLKYEFQGRIKMLETIKDWINLNIES